MLGLTQDHEAIREPRGIPRHARPGLSARHRRAIIAALTGGAVVLALIAWGIVHSLASPPGGDVRACQLVQGGHYAQAQAVAVSPDLRQEIGDLRYAISQENDPYPLSMTAGPLKSSSLTLISSICQQDGVNGISGQGSLAETPQR